jgi:hypothetical protein
MLRFATLVFGLAACISLPAIAQSGDSQDKTFDVHSSVGDMHVGPDADAKAIGLPIYPGAHPKHEADNNPLNFGILTETFGMKLVVAKYESNDSPEKILNFYRDKMKKYGKVLECHNLNDNSGVHSDDDHDSSKPLKCEGDNTGPVRELKVGTEGNAHILAIEDPDASKGTTFSLVYLHTRGKRGEI